MTKAVLIFLLVIAKSFSQGKYAEEFSSLLQKKFVTEKELVELKNFKYQQGKILGEVSANGIYGSSMEVFKKGNTALVIVSKLTNPETKTKTVIEVLKLSKILNSQEIRISSCSRKNAYPNEVIVAVITANTSKLKIAQVYALKDIRFEKIPSKGVKCILNEME